MTDKNMDQQSYDSSDQTSEADYSGRPVDPFTREERRGDSLPTMPTSIESQPSVQPQTSGQPPLPAQAQVSSQPSVPVQSQTSGQPPLPPQTPAQDQSSMSLQGAMTKLPTVPGAPTIPGQAPISEETRSNGGAARPRKNRPFLICMMVLGFLALLFVASCSGFMLGGEFVADRISVNSQQAAPLVPQPSSSAPLAASTAKDVAAKTIPSIASVYAELDNGVSNGSGVIIDTDGNIITNNHVIEGFKSLQVSINGKIFEAKLVGTDPSSDLAVIHADLEDTKVTPISKGDSSQLVPGDWVMTVGSPFGLEQSVSQGIVSALSRSEVLSTKSGQESLYTNLIQIDAAVNPGNSGGALVNERGELVGICTLFSSDTDSFAGIGFAIPGNYAWEVASSLIKHEPIRHAYLGVSMSGLDARTAQRYNLNTDHGVYLIAVDEKGPAAAAGLKQGDVIVSVDDHDVMRPEEVQLLIRAKKPGDTLKLHYLRDGELNDVSVTLGSDENIQNLQNQQDQLLLEMLQRSQKGQK